MGFFSRLFSPAPERHSIDKMALWGTGAVIGDPVWTGVNVSQESALRLSVVWRCIRIISETCAALPADIVREVGEVRQTVDRPPRWIEFPNPEASWFEFAERVFESMAMDGNAFILITGRDSLGFPSEMWTLNPQQVDIKRRANGALYFLWNGTQVLSKYGPTTPDGDVLHLRLATAGGVRGLSPIEYHKQAVGLGLATEKFGARYFGGDNQPPGVIEIPAMQAQEAQETVDRIAAMWKARHGGTDKSGNVAVLSGGASFRPLAIPNDQAQFLDTRKFQVEEIASRIYGVPPHMVGLTEKQTSWGTGIEQQATGFIRFTLLPWIIRFETAMSQLLPRGQTLRLNQRGLLRADSKTESEVLTQQLLNGIINANEFRALMDREPRPGGDRYMVPLNYQILDAAGHVPKPEPVPPALSNGNGKVDKVTVGGAADA